MAGFMDGFQKIGKDVQDKLDWRKITVLAGDLSVCKWDFNGGMMTPDPSTGLADCVPLQGEIKKMTLQTEESVKDLAKTLGFTVAGGMIMGPFGAVAGYLASGDRKQMCVLVEMNDGKKFLAKMDQRIYQQMLSLSMM